MYTGQECEWTYLSCKHLDLIESGKEKRQVFTTFCSIVKICIDRDNLLFALLPDTQTSVCQMRKSLKLSVKVKF